MAKPAAKMTPKELYALIVKKFLELPGVDEILDSNIEITVRSLTAEEAIGKTDRTDYPILTGRDVMIEATYNGFKGQAFTEAPADFRGTIKQILELPFETDEHARGLLIATLNAVMGYMGHCDRMIHCRNDGPKLCGKEIAKQLMSEYSLDTKILVVGYQPSIIANLSENFNNIRALDLDPQNIGTERCGIKIENGATDMDDAWDWAELILCTGSTVCNGTLVDYMDTGKETLFFGTSLAAVASLLGLKRICYADTVS